MSFPAPALRLIPALLFLTALPLAAATLPTGFTEDRIARGLENPTAMALAPDGRLFVAEKEGTLRVIKNGTLLPAPFLTVPVSFLGERGLVGVTLDPDFPRTPYVYVYYTVPTPAVHNRLSRFTADGDRAAPGSEVVLLDLDNLSEAAFHNGGALHFGPDGKLYVAAGDNGKGPNAQSLKTLLGKILRLEADGSIPSDNPFYSTASGNNRAIWALGLRNPFTFSFQPGTGRMFINDVGQDAWEEIDDGLAGSNYGWPVTEGPAAGGRFRSPLFSYAHGSGGTSGCAITGGAFYNPENPQFPDRFTGSYFFADYCNGWIRRYNPRTNTAFAFATGIPNAVDLQVAGDGSLYYLAYGSGEVFRVYYTGNPAPRITSQPVDTIVAPRRPVTFTAGASGAPPLSWQWRRNGIRIPGATGASYTLKSARLADSGARFDVVVTNSSGSATSNAARLTVSDGRPPQATITAPADPAVYRAGDTITYSGQGTDPEDGRLPAQALTWQVDFHHEDHVHPFLPPTRGVTGGSFTIPRRGETSPDVWYRILLTVQDSGGLTHTASVDLVPHKAVISLATSPPGLRLTLDGQPVTAPYSVQGVTGLIRRVGAVSPQTVGGTTYELVSWSDGGGAVHPIQTPESDTTYTATFRVVDPAAAPR
jgi:glucose/arabinose dehydrogenase